MLKKWILLMVVLCLPLLMFSADKTDPKTTAYERSLPGFDDEPEWVQEKPQKSGYFYFVGMGSARSRVKAYKNAEADAYSKIVLYINATITSDSSFSEVYEERDEEESMSKRGIQKTRVKGKAFLKKIKFPKKHAESSSEGYDAYVLAEVPKKEILAAIKRMEDLRKKLAETPTAVVALSMNKKTKEVSRNEKIEAAYENFYTEQGYNIQSIDIDVDKLSSKSVKANISRLKKMLKKKGIKMLIFAAITIKRERTENIQGTDWHVVEGILTVREIYLTKKKKIVKALTIAGKGINPYDFDKAYIKFENDLLEKLLGGGEEEEDDEDF